MHVIFIEQLPMPSATHIQRAHIIERVSAILGDANSVVFPRLEAEIASENSFKILTSNQEDLGGHPPPK